MKVLITGGGTTEKIDEMRVITNQSSGKTALSLANTLSEANEVTLWKSKNIKTKFLSGIEAEFESCQDLLNLFEKSKSEEFDLIIHAAAVGDYEVSRIETDFNISSGKIPSGLEDLVLHLKPTKKIINQIKKIYPKTYLIGFKLTDELNRDEIFKKISRLKKAADTDAIVHNIIQERYNGIDNFYLYSKGDQYKVISGTENLASELLKKYMLNIAEES